MILNTQFYTYNIPSIDTRKNDVIRSLFYKTQQTIMFHVNLFNNQYKSGASEAVMWFYSHLPSKIDGLVCSKSCDILIYYL